MKKILILLLLVMLCGCKSTERNDFFVLNFDNYTYAPGYDNVEFLGIIFDFDLQKATNEEKDIQIDLFGKRFGYVDTCLKDDELIVDKMVIYLKDNPQMAFGINGISLSESIEENCKNLKGTLFSKNGKACELKTEISGTMNYVLLFNDITDIDDDRLDRIEVSAEIIHK